MNGPYILAFCHKVQTDWYGLIAREIQREYPVSSVCWVLGARDFQRAEEHQYFDEVRDLLEGFDPTDDASRYEHNLLRLSQFEDSHLSASYHEDVAIDRMISKLGWKSPRIAAYAVHLIDRIKMELDRLGRMPVLALGENNQLAYRLAHAIVGEEVPYVHFGLARHWDQRFYWSHNGSFRWLECQRLYRLFMEEGIPSDLENEARAKLDALRAHHIQPRSAMTVGEGERSFLNVVRLVRRGFSVNGEAERWVSGRKMELQSSGGFLRGLRRGWAIVRRGATSSWTRATLAYRRREFYRRAETCIGDGRRYATHFLHVQPEYVVDELAFEYRDELCVVRNIAAQLPADMLLVVKEHAPMIGRRSSDFYREIEEIPNAMLVTDRCSSYELIEGSVFISTLAGSASLEAVYVGKPALVFGGIFSEVFEGVVKVGSLREMGEAIKAALRVAADVDWEKSAVTALSAMYAASSPGKIGRVYSYEEIVRPENIRRLAAPLKEWMETRWRVGSREFGSWGG